MNGHTGIDTIEATEHLKNILNVGKSESESSKIKSVTNGKMEAAGDVTSVLNDAPYQKVILPANKDCCHISIYGNEVDIYSSPLEYGASCSQVIVEDMVDYGWKEKYYYGKIISIHLSGKYLAYVLRPSSNKPSLVRILGLHLNLRQLIKDYKSEVKDIAFAHTTNQVLLGSVDECGEFFVHKIIDNGTSLICNLLVHILRPAEWVPSEHNRIIWCLYIPDDNDTGDDDTSSEDVTALLVVTHNERAEIWNIQTILREHGHGELTIDEVKVGVQVISEHKQPISAATFSPDGTALAIGSLDGIVKFFQVNTLEKDISPRCLHHWTPHPEKSLSSFYFLDNHKNHKPDVQFWKCAVTGADNNTELKIWSCETWACLQTIKIHANPDDCITPCLKAEIDLSSRYLFLTDIKRKVLLILLIEQDSVSSSAFIRSFSEFKVPFPLLSLAISSVSYSKLHSTIGDNNSDEEGDNVMNIIEAFNNQEEMHGHYIVKLFWIQPKTLQSCRIIYKPKVESPVLSVGSVSSLSQDSFVFKDGLSDTSLDVRDSSSRSGKDLDLSLQKGMHVVDELCESSLSNSTLNVLPPHIPNFSNCAEVLLTPDDFTSPSHSNLNVQNFQDKSSSVSKCDTAVHLTDSIDSLPVEPNTLQRRKSSQHSATSSPSREVAEILAPTKVLHLNEMVDENESLSIKDDSENLTNSLSSFNIPSAPLSARSQSDLKPDYHVKDWPQAPHPNKEYRLSSRNENESASHNQIFHSTKSESPSNTFEMSPNRPLLQLGQSFNEMVLKIESLTNVLQEQRCEIQSLQNEVKSLRQDQKHNQSATNLSSKLDHLISHRVVPDNSRLENLILRTAEENHQRSKSEWSHISGELSNSLGNRLESTVKQELSNCVVPQINNVLDNVGQKMQLDFSQKTTIIDSALRDTVSKNLKGKIFLDAVSQSISTSVQSQIQSSCKDIFQSSVVPAFEKSCQLLFQQLNEVFNKGTTEYVHILEKQGQSSCSAIDSSVAHLREEMKNLLSNSQQLVRTQAAQVENHNTELLKQEEKFLSGIRQTIQDEVKKAFKEQTTSVLNSRSVTPVPQPDLYVQKQRLLQLIQQGSIDEAFQQALSAMDVQLVLYLCEHVNPDQVFGTTPCCLQQHVLLSLVNQLSADLSVKTDIKVRYIEDVIASLDCNSTIIRDHIRNVLENLQQRIANFLQRNPNHKLSRNLKRISLAVQSLIVF